MRNARRNKGPRVDILSRDVLPEVWVAVPAEDGRVVVPTAHEARTRMMRRLDVDAEEALRCEALLPSSFVQAFAFYRDTVERNRSAGRAPRGFDFVYPNLNGHMNYYAIFLLFLEYAFDVRYYHAQIFKCYLAFKHVCKTADDNVKILHTILFGPPSSGKSFAMDLCKRMTPPGIALPVTHVSDQRNAVKLGNADELSCQVQIHDEANASMLGMAEASNGRQRVAQNALSSTATEYKESLTNRRPTSCVMQVTKEGGRTRELFEWNNDIVSFQLTNNFPKLAPPMMSRFNSVCFYSIPRLDVMDSKRRAMDPARERLAKAFAEHQQLLYVLQLRFDTLQACGICAPVPEEGWKVLACEFERVLRESFPFAVTETLSLDRKLSDAFQYVRMMVNTYAVYITFAHPRAPFTDLAAVSMESFRMAERYVTPSDQMMMLALSMLEPDLFPTGEVNVLSVLCSMVEDRVRAEASLASLRPGELHPLMQPEFPLVELYSDLTNYANTLADDEEDGGGERPRPVHAMVVDHNPTAPVPGQPAAARISRPPALWRTLSAQRERMVGAIGALAGKRDEFERSYLPTLEKAEIAAVLPRMQYAVAYQGAALSEDDFRERAAEEIYTRMQAKDNTSMPNDHVRSALFMLSCRSMKDADAKGATHILKSTLKVATVEEVAQPVGTRSRIFRLVVSKTAMDELRNGGLTVKAVLEKMLHRHSLPGTYLLNAPMLVDKRTGELLPQLAQALHVGIHKVGCLAVPGATDGAALAAAARRAEEEAPPGVFSTNRFWAWAGDALVTARNCNCWRSRIISNTRGCAMPEGVRTVMGAVLGSAGAAAANGLDESGMEAMGCPFQELGWVAHVTRLTGRSPHAMTDAELRAAGLEHAHPSSMHWVQPLAGVEVRRYPYVERCDYVFSSAQQRGSVTTARRENMFADEGGLDAMAPDIVREYEAGLRA